MTTSSTPIFQNEECLECSDECIPDELLLMKPAVILKKLQRKELTNNSSSTFLSEPLEKINKIGFDPNFTLMDMKCQRCDQMFINKKCLIGMNWLYTKFHDFLRYILNKVYLVLVAKSNISVTEKLTLTRGMYNIWFKWFYF